MLARGLAREVQVTPSGCLGPCFDGPNLVIYPQGAWYERLDADDIPALVDHLAGGPGPTHRLRPTDTAED